MGLFKRMGRLLSANLNELLEHCEDPEKLLKQAVRDMETALGRLMDAAARGIAHERLLGRQLGEHRREIERYRQFAEAAADRADDDDARRALRRKADYERLASVLSEHVVAAGELSSRLRKQVSAMRIKLAEARQKQLEVTARSRAVAARRDFATGLEGVGVDGSAMTEFDRMLSRVEQSEANTDALLEIIGEAEESDLLDLDIEAQLQALKEKRDHAAH